MKVEKYSITKAAEEDQEVQKRIDRKKATDQDTRMIETHIVTIAKRSLPREMFMIADTTIGNLNTRETEVIRLIQIDLPK